MAFFSTARMPTITSGVDPMNTEVDLTTVKHGSWLTMPSISPPMLVVSTPDAVFNPVDEQRIHERVRDFLSGKTPCLVLPAGYIAQRIN